MLPFLCAKAQIYIQDHKQIYSIHLGLKVHGRAAKKTVSLKIFLGPGMVAQACNPSTSGGWGGWFTRSRDRDHPGQHGETLSLLKIQKISWAWWRVPVIPATREAETGELPEPKRQRLRWAEIAPLHCSLGNKNKTPSQKKKTNRFNKSTNI